MIFNAQIVDMLLLGLKETVYMVFLSSFLSYVIGIPLGILLVVTDRDGIQPNIIVNTLLGIIINILRSVPFIIMLLAVLPITRFIVRTTLGPSAVVVPLVIAASPYIARMVESSLKEMNAGIVEAAKSMGGKQLPDYLEGHAAGVHALAAHRCRDFHHDHTRILHHGRLCGRAVWERWPSTTVIIAIAWM